MSATLSITGFLAIVAWIQHVTVPPGTRMRLFTHLTLGLIASAGWLARHFPVRVAVALVLVLLVVSCREVFRSHVGPGRHPSPATPGDRIAFVFVGVGGIVVAVATAWQLAEPALLDTLFRYFLLFPLAVLAGRSLVGAGAGLMVQRALVWWSSALAVVAVLERVVGRHVITIELVTSSYFREGNVRAVVLAEHPLVLAVLLLLGLATVHRLLRGGWRVGLIALHLAGIWSTGSRGPMLLAVAYLVIRSIATNEVLQGRLGSLAARTAVAALCVGTVALLFFQSDIEGGIAVTGNTPAEASSNYRLVLFEVMAFSLGTHPFGWGLGGLPPWEIVIASPFGPLDVSTSIDSELVLAAIEFGYLGIAAFIATLSLAILAASSRLPNGDLLLLICGAGTFLALHAWAGLGTLLFLFVGLVSREVGMVRARDRQAYATT